MKKDPNQKTKFVTNLYPQSKIEVSGPCEIYIQRINEHDQIEFVIITERKYSIDTFKLNKPYSLVNGNK
jgi:hypothetical protein